MGPCFGRRRIDRMLSLVRTALLPALHVLPTSGAHVRACARGLSSAGVLPSGTGLSGSYHLPAELFAMATAHGAGCQRMLRIGNRSSELQIANLKLASIVNLRFAICIFAIHWIILARLIHHLHPMMPVVPES